jgi:hypothetical protein
MKSQKGYIALDGEREVRHAMKKLVQECLMIFRRETAIFMDARNPMATRSHQCAKQATFSAAICCLAEPDGKIGFLLFFVSTDKSCFDMTQASDMQRRLEQTVPRAFVLQLSALALVVICATCMQLATHPRVSSTLPCFLKSLHAGPQIIDVYVYVACCRPAWRRCLILPMREHACSS